MSDRRVKPRKNLIEQLAQLVRTKPSMWLMLSSAVLVLALLVYLPSPWSSLLLFGLVAISALILIADRIAPQQTKTVLPTANRVLTFIERVITNHPRPIALIAIVLIALAAIWMAPIERNANPLHPRIMRGVFALILGGWILRLALIIAPNREANPRRLPLAGLELSRFYIDCTHQILAGRFWGDPVVDGRRGEWRFVPYSPDSCHVTASAICGADCRNRAGYDWHDRGRPLELVAI